MQLDLDDDPTHILYTFAKSTAPEIKLWLAVVADAMLVYATGSKKAKERERLWFTSESDDIYSYRWICEHVNLDPDWLWEKRAIWEKALKT